MQGTKRSGCSAISGRYARRWSPRRCPRSSPELAGAVRVLGRRHQARGAAAPSRTGVCIRRHHGIGVGHRCERHDLQRDRPTHPASAIRRREARSSIYARTARPRSVFLRDVVSCILRDPYRSGAGRKDVHRADIHADRGLRRPGSVEQPIFVDADYFGVLGSRPALGRYFVAADFSARTAHPSRSSVTDCGSASSAPIRRPLDARSPSTTNAFGSSALRRATSTVSRPSRSTSGFR